MKSTELIDKVGYCTTHAVVDWHQNLYNEQVSPLPWQVIFDHLDADLGTYEATAWWGAGLYIWQITGTR